MGLDPEYVLYRMEPFEAAALLSNRDMGRRDAWERTRVLAYMIAQANATKPLTPQDVLPLPWDLDDNSTDNNPSPEEMENLMNRVKIMETYLNGKQ